MTNTTFPTDSIRWFSNSGSSRGAAGSEPLTLDVGSFTFTGAAGRFALNHQTVWFPLIANMPGFYGARPVVNWFLNSDTPGAPTAWDTVTDALATFAATTDTYNGETIGALTITNAATAGGPYLNGYSGNWRGATVAASPYASGQWPGMNAWPAGTLMTVRMLARTVTAPTGWALYQRARDNAVAPTESLGGTVTLTTSFQTITGTMEQSAPYTALATRLNLGANGTGDGRVARVQLEDLSGDKDSLISGEYVPSGSTPGWRWFSTAKATTSSNSAYTANYSALVPLKTPGTALPNSAGVLTDGTGAALSGLLGLVMEPAASNICGGWSTLGNIGSFKSSAAMTGRLGTKPWAAGVTTIYFEAPSGMMVGNFNGTAPTDITLTLNGVSAGNDSIDSTTTNFVTAGFFVGMTIWVWRADTLSFGPMPVASVTATKIGLTGTFFGTTKASGTGTRIMRCPGNGDNIMLQLNDGTWHRTTVSGAVTIPAAGAWDTKAPVTCPITAGPPSDGGWSTGNTDNGVHAFYWKDETDFGISKSGGTGVTVKPVFDRVALIAAGLGYLSPSGLALEIYGGTSGSGTITLGATAGLGTGSRDTRVSIWHKVVTDAANNFQLKLEAHANLANLTASTWTRSNVQQTSAGTQCRPQIITVPGETTYVIAWQTEQAAASETAVVSSPIPTYGATAAVTRTATRCTRAWGSTAKNGIQRSLTWTPSQGALAQKQTLYYLFADASNYLELSITNTTITWRKRRGGTNYDVTASYTPVAGTSVALAFGISSSLGVTLTVDGVAATPNTTDLFDITALTQASTEDIGSSAGASTAYGYFKDLVVA